MNDYTPTTENVKKLYTDWDELIGSTASPEAFDRWLAAHDAEVAATTLDLAAADTLIRFSSEAATITEEY